jgi:hypothetical protein
MEVQMSGGSWGLLVLYAAAASCEAAGLWLLVRALQAFRQRLVPVSAALSVRWAVKPSGPDLRTVQERREDVLRAELGEGITAMQHEVIKERLAREDLTGRVEKLELHAAGPRDWQGAWLATGLLAAGLALGAAGNIASLWIG